LFEPFITHGKASGTGLGLAIARSVVEAHGGKISLSSVHGSGTTVDIRLPKPTELPAAEGLSASRGCDYTYSEVFYAGR
jgi:signal transduction histidine kinase